MYAISRLLFLALLALPVFFVSARAQPATVVVTIDYYAAGLVNGLAIMQPRNLPATFFVPVTSGDLDLIDNYPGVVPTSAQLAAAQAAGWEIGIYSNRSMPAMLNGTADAEVSTGDFLITQKNKLLAKGFAAKSFAAGGRAWNEDLARVSHGIFHNVRVAYGGPVWQPYPIPDRNNVTGGYTASLGPSDTVASLTTQLNDLIASGTKSWFIITHKVGPETNDPYTIPTPVFTGFMDALVAARNAGLIRVVTFHQAMSPPAN